MSLQQFRQTLKNGRKTTSFRLGDSAAPAGVLRSAQRRHRSLERARRAWETVADAEWLPFTEIESFEGGELRIRAAAAQWGQLQGLTDRLLRPLRSHLPGLERLRFIPVDGRSSGEKREDKTGWSRD